MNAIKNILNGVKNNRATLEKEISSLKKDSKYHVYPEYSQLVGCAEMIVFMNQDDFLSASSEKELKNINNLLNEAVSLLVHARGGL